MVLQVWDVEYNLKDTSGLSLALFSLWPFFKQVKLVTWSSWRYPYALWSIIVTVLYVPLKLEVAIGLKKGLPCVVVADIYMLSAIYGRPYFLYMSPWHLEVKNALHESIHEATPSVQRIWWSQKSNKWLLVGKKMLTKHVL